MLLYLVPSYTQSFWAQTTLYSELCFHVNTHTNWIIARLDYLLSGLSFIDVAPVDWDNTNTSGDLSQHYMLHSRCLLAGFTSPPTGQHENAIKGRSSIAPCKSAAKFNMQMSYTGILPRACEAHCCKWNFYDLVAGGSCSPRSGPCLQGKKSDWYFFNLFFIKGRLLAEHWEWIESKLGGEGRKGRKGREE